MKEFYHEKSPDLSGLVPYMKQPDDPATFGRSDYA